MFNCSVDDDFLAWKEKFWQSLEALYSQPNGATPSVNGVNGATQKVRQLNIPPRNKIIYSKKQSMKKKHSNT
jgi:hypothetical protein